MSDGNQLEELLEAAAPAPAAAEEFQFGTLPPEISFQTERVPPPAWLYVGAGDRLWVVAWNAMPNSFVAVHVRLLLPNGKISMNLYNMPLTDDRARNELFIPLVESFLLSVTVTPGPVMPPGSCWVRVLLLNGGGSAISYPQGIVGGYIAKGGALTWPYPRFQNPVEGPGRLRIITGTDPPPGWEINEVVPVGARWRLLAMRATVVTSAVVSDRYTSLYFDDGLTTWYNSAPLAVRTAGVNGDYDWGIGVAPRNGPPTGFFQDALPDGITLAAGWRFHTNTIGRDVGDDWGAPVYYVEEWVEP